MGELKQRATRLAKLAARDPRFNLEIARGHFKVRDAATGIPVAVIPASPSDYRGMRNCESALARVGLDVGPHNVKAERADARRQRREER